MHCVEDAEVMRQVDSVVEGEEPEEVLPPMPDQRFQTQVDGPRGSPVEVWCARDAGEDEDEDDLDYFYDDDEDDLDDDLDDDFGDDEDDLDDDVTDDDENDL